MHWDSRSHTIIKTATERKRCNTRVRHNPYTYGGDVIIIIPILLWHTIRSVMVDDISLRRRVRKGLAVEVVEVGHWSLDQGMMMRSSGLCFIIALSPAPLLESDNWWHFQTPLEATYAKRFSLSFSSGFEYWSIWLKPTLIVLRRLL